MSSVSGSDSVPVLSESSSVREDDDEERNNESNSMSNESNIDESSSGGNDEGDDDSNDSNSVFEESEDSNDTVDRAREYKGTKVKFTHFVDKINKGDFIFCPKDNKTYKVDDIDKKNENYPIITIVEKIVKEKKKENNDKKEKEKGKKRKESEEDEKDKKKKKKDGKKKKSKKKEKKDNEDEDDGNEEKKDTVNENKKIENDEEQKGEDKEDDDEKKENIKEAIKEKEEDKTVEVIQEEEKKEEEDKSETEKKTEDEVKEDNKSLNDKPQSIDNKSNQGDSKKKNKKEKSKDKDKDKDKEKENKKTKQKITIENYYEYTVFRNIKIFYFNYLNKSIVMNYPVNINSSFDDFAKDYCALYKIKHEYLEIIFRNEKVKELSPNNFKPKNYNYDKDFLILVESEEGKEMKTSIYNDKNTEMFSKGQAQHIIIPRYNMNLTKITVPSEIDSLSLEIYKIFTNELSNTTYRKKRLLGRDLFNSNWKQNAELVYNIKSSVCKLNKISYNISGKEYSLNNVFLKEKNIYMFSLGVPDGKCSYTKVRSGDYGDFSIIPEKEKSLILEFSGTKVSDMAFLK